MVLRESCFGLCGTCDYGRKVSSKQGSGFLLCRRSIDDPSYPKYPRTPVMQCPGYAGPGEHPDSYDSGGQAVLDETGGDDGSTDDGDNGESAHFDAGDPG